MFGYIVPDKPNMYIRDYTVYRAFYCGICKCTGKMYGQLMRFSTNYDITFFSILLHNILDQRFELNNETCILSPLKKRSIVRTNPLMNQAVYLNALLAEFKVKDDIKDTKGIKAKLLKIALKGKVRRARAALPDVSNRIDIARYEQNRVELSRTDSVDRAAHTFASMMRDIFKIMCKDKYTEDIGGLAYQLGRFIYIVDAIDDYDKDKLHNHYNPLVISYGTIFNKKELLLSKGEDLLFMLKSAYNEIKRCYKSMHFKMCEGVVTNILWYGLDSAIKKYTLIEGGKL